MKSMTGYGKGVASVDGRELTIELKSVNHRFLDIGMRVPRILSCTEEIVRQTISSRLSRGHVDVFFNYRNTRTDAKTVRIDETLLYAYLNAARVANEHACLQDDLTLTAALRLPDVTEIIPQDEDTEVLKSLALQATALALDALEQMRLNEGERLKSALAESVGKMQSYRSFIMERAPFVADEYRKKLYERIASIVTEVEPDASRLATEIAIFADRCCIDEEIVRLGSHITQFLAYLETEEPIGRKMDFIIQEMNRECNTIGSKANDAELTNTVLLCKAEIEKLREQIQNVE